MIVKTKALFTPIAAPEVSCSRNIQNEMVPEAWAPALSVAPSIVGEYLELGLSRISRIGQTTAHCRFFFAQVNSANPLHSWKFWVALLLVDLGSDLDRRSLSRYHSTWSSMCEKKAVNYSNLECLGRCRCDNRKSSIASDVVGAIIANLQLPKPHQADPSLSNSSSLLLLY